MTIRNCHVVILGGGGLFQDQDLKAPFIWWWQVFWTQVFRKPLFIYATSVGPLKTKISQFFCAWVYKKAKIITVRDQKSVTVLKNIGVNQNIHITADPVFNLYLKPQNSPQKNLILISLRPCWGKTTNLIEVIMNYIAYLAKKNQHLKFLFINMQADLDNPLNQKVIDKLPLNIKKRSKIVTPQKLEDLTPLFRKTKIAIGLRFHFIVLATMHQIPILPINYSQKCQSLSQQLEIKSIDINNLNITRLLQLSSEIMENNILVDIKILNKLKERAKINDELFDQLFLLQHHPS